jgi:predicted NUDIX family NTP pyrophosphohydrolase
MHEFPELNRTMWFNLLIAQNKLLLSQRPFPDQLQLLLSLSPSKQ